MIKMMPRIATKIPVIQINFKLFVNHQRSCFKTIRQRLRTNQAKQGKIKPIAIKATPLIINASIFKPTKVIQSLLFALDQYSFDLKAKPELHPNDVFLIKTWLILIDQFHHQLFGKVDH